MVNSEEQTPQAEKRRQVMQNAARLAGKIIFEADPTQVVEVKKGSGNFTTKADKDSEQAILDTIRASFPDDSILSEETESDIQDPLLVDRLWVIDPIDGTNNFIHGRNYSAVSIAYVEKGKVKMGAVYNPFRNELFYAEEGKGATLNSGAITVSDVVGLAEATISTDPSYNSDETRRNLEVLLRLDPIPRIQMLGSSVLMMCDVAAGRRNIFYILDTLEPWDNAAAHLIAREAGAVVKDFEGRDVDFTSRTVVLGNPTLVNQFLELVKTPHS